VRPEAQARRHQERLTPDLRAAWRARAVLRERLTRAVPPTLLVDALLLASELVTNSVLHAGAAGNLDLVLERDPRRLRVEVWDDGPGIELPAAPEPPTAGVAGGRGLVLLTRIADRAGTLREDRACVWFELDLPDPGR
jgi:anti-sigma regulatory factor (Ser/Thr protein kinase)